MTDKEDSRTILKLHYDAHGMLSLQVHICKDKPDYIQYFLDVFQGKWRKIYSTEYWSWINYCEYCGIKFEQKNSTEKNF